jgi:hypothetical protein
MRSRLEACGSHPKQKTYLWKIILSPYLTTKIPRTPHSLSSRYHSNSTIDFIWSIPLHVSSFPRCKKPCLPTYSPCGRLGPFSICQSWMLVELWALISIIMHNRTFI